MHADTQEDAEKTQLPGSFRQFFWDYDFGSLTWEENHHFIVARILASGDWESITWVRKKVGDAGLRQWIMERQGRGLTPRQLRFWQLILNLPRRDVDAWLAAPERQTWDRRRKR